MTSNDIEDLSMTLVCPSNFYSNYDSIVAPQITQE